MYDENSKQLELEYDGVYVGTVESVLEDKNQTLVSQVFNEDYYNHVIESNFPKEHHEYIKNEYSGFIIDGSLDLPYGVCGKGYNKDDYVYRIIKE